MRFKLSVSAVLARNLQDSQDGSLRNLIDETESLFKSREQEYQQTIGEIEVRAVCGTFPFHVYIHITALLTNEY